ncbi:MAG: hypothetical protein ACTHJT_05245 [Cytophaga sp.]|uniref:lamin tail domain-containing protein n=1 Tax=Cytophaga sp. TaxID=29535 RepID=UPI003F7F4191
MKALIFIILGVFFVVPQYLHAQSYTFTEGTIPVDWFGQKTYFEIDTDQQLHLNAPSGTKDAHVAWPFSGKENCVWEFFLRYDFAASTTNYASFYLCSEQEDFAAATNRSYYLKMGGATGSADKIELIYQDGSAKTTVLESRAGIMGASTVAIRVRVNRSNSGSWKLYTDESTGSNFTKEAEGAHIAPYTFSYSGIRCIYSSTRKDKMYFDDIRIYEPFALTGYSISGERSIILSFSKEIKMPASMIEMMIEDIYTVFVHEKQIEITVSKDIQPGTYVISAHTLSSVDGDTLLDSMIKVIKQPTYYTGQIRFTEWMSDPSPSYGLPEIEWIELFNTSAVPVDLFAFTLSDPSAGIKLPQYLLAPDAAVIVCASDGCKLFDNDNCIEVPSLPNLSNTADSLFLYAHDTLLIDYIHYALTDMPDDYRKNGGYSIVRVQLPAACILTQQLSFSDEQTGGSPGRVNQFMKPASFSIPVKAEYVNEKQLRLELPVMAWAQSNGFQPGEIIASVQIIPSKFCTGISLLLNTDIEEGDAFTIQIDSMETCLHYPVYLGKSVEVIRPKSIEKGEVFINEILYNAVSGSVDFMELFNTTDAYIDLKNTHYVNAMQGGTIQHFAITESLAIAPHGYVALTADTTVLIQQYMSAVRENCLERSNFLSFSDDGGEMFFLNSSSDTLDYIEYGDRFQNPLNRKDEGISLEKIRSHDAAFTASNWTSSAVGATPGYQNSQTLGSELLSSNIFYCNPCHATVNLNGNNDYVHLHLNPMVEGAFASVSIYTITGELVDKLCVNQLLGTSNTFNWYGQQQSSAPLPDGIYVAVAEWWSPAGDTHTEKIAISTSQY